MNEQKLKKIYRIVRIVIFAIPVFIVVIGLYIVLFPVDTYRFYPDDPKLSKFNITKDSQNNELTFGVFPLRNYRFVDLAMNLKKSEKQNCAASNAEVSLEKTYQAFLFPTADEVTSEDQLHDLLFDSNKTKFPNGSLLHLKPTNEVFFISHGKKILFPGPEIFQAFGYSFDNLTEVEQSDVDQFPDADQKVFLWTMSHPDGTIFQAFPSHTLYLVFNGKKYLIADKDLLDKVWPSNFAIPVSDPSPENHLKCDKSAAQTSISCKFDTSRLSDIGRFYQFSIKYPANCSIDNVHPATSVISFFSEHSTTTIKSSLQNIVTSVLNRYFYKQ